MTSDLHAELAIAAAVNRRLFPTISYNIGYQHSVKEITSSLNAIS